MEEEASASLVGAKEISMDATFVAILSELGGIFILKEHK